MNGKDLFLSARIRAQTHDKNDRLVIANRRLKLSNKALRTVDELPLYALILLLAADPFGISLAPLQRQESISSEEAAELRRVLVDLIHRTQGIEAREVPLTDLLAGKGPSVYPVWEDLSFGRKTRSGCQRCRS